jgi:anti-sigma factor RsiW
MTCIEAEPLLNAYLDGELDLTSCVNMERHLAECRACQAQYASLERLRDDIAAADLRYEPGPELERRIKAAFGAPASAPVRRTASWAPSLAAAAIAAVVLIAVIVPARMRMGGPTTEREILDSHLRSLMANHLVDVPSSDRHTVKPWFQGKTGFSPPALDLSTQGFNLIGGRLEVVRGRPAAAIVYKRRNHVINLFVFEGGASAAGISQQETDGYHLVRWTQGGLSYCAVSDLNPAELRAFAEEFRSH